ncbi:hypothetical protein V8B97DRAFT_1944744 [Scleroderma yunnanense]
MKGMNDGTFHKGYVEHNILDWMPYTQKPLDIGDSIELPLMCPSSMISPMQKHIIHGAGCILVLEYSYFCLQAQANPKEVISFAVEEYQHSGIQDTVVKALQQAINEHKKDHSKLQHAIINIILENHMSNKFKVAHKATGEA